MFIINVSCRNSFIYGFEYVVLLIHSFKLIKIYESKALLKMLDKTLIKTGYKLGLTWSFQNCIWFSSLFYNRDLSRISQYFYRFPQGSCWGWYEVPTRILRALYLPSSTLRIETGKEPGKIWFSSGPIRNASSLNLVLIRVLSVTV